jgi:hypothetical protein
MQAAAGHDDARGEVCLRCWRCRSWTAATAATAIAVDERLRRATAPSSAHVPEAASASALCGLVLPCAARHAAWMPGGSRPAATEFEVGRTRAGVRGARCWVLGARFAPAPQATWPARAGQSGALRANVRLASHLPRSWLPSP